MWAGEALGRVTEVPPETEMECEVTRREAGNQKKLYGPFTQCCLRCDGVRTGIVGLLCLGGIRPLLSAGAQGRTILRLGQQPLGEIQSILEFADLGLLAGNVRLHVRQG